MLGQTSRVLQIKPKKTKKKVHINTCPEMNGF
jgi:hypothetical protein